MATPIPASSILDALPSEVSRGLFAQGRSVSLDAEQTLFLAGDKGDGCYRVEEGLLKASVGAPNGSERILGILGPGSVVGELSMIDGAPRSASSLPGGLLSLTWAGLAPADRASFAWRLPLFDHLVGAREAVLRTKEPRLPHCAASILSISGPNLGLACNSSRNALVASSKGLRTMSLTIVTPALTASFRD